MVTWPAARGLLSGGEYTTTGGTDPSATNPPLIFRHPRSRTTARSARCPTRRTVDKCRRLSRRLSRRRRTCTAAGATRPAPRGLWIPSRLSRRPSGDGPPNAWWNALPAGCLPPGAAERHPRGDADASTAATASHATADAATAGSTTASGRRTATAAGATASAAEFIASATAATATASNSGKSSRRSGVGSTAEHSSNRSGK